MVLHDNIGWFWTKDGTYPYLYSQYSSDWLFLDLNSLDPKRYYNFAISEWENLSRPNVDVQLAALMRNNSGTTNPRGLKRQAIQLISESDISEEEANKRIAKIILYGL